jgi:uncharacterized 2Fe-2S/4Fe-4S cluster protein (DUF4445 family)
MKQNEIKITFQPSGRSIYVLPGTTLLEAAARAGFILQTPCGGKGTCGKCKVRVTSGHCAEPVPNSVLSNDQIRQGFRLACQAKAEEPLVIEIPAASLFEHEHQILIKSGKYEVKLSPYLRKIYFTLEEPSMQNPQADLARLRQALGDIRVSYKMLRHIPQFLRNNQWKGTAVLADRQLIALEKGDTCGSLYGVAFDIGTTTMVGTLIDLACGTEAAVSAGMNPQVTYGDDVLSRVQHVREQPGSLSELQAVLIDAINKLIERMAAEKGISLSSIYDISVAGNTAMQQIFCGLNPHALGEIPFTPVFDQAFRIPAESLGIKANPASDTFVFGQVGGFVGGDTVAGMLASRIDQWGKPVLLVDIGTNGEIVLFNQGRMWAASTAAGPAFEGARISHGMRATAGAIEKVIMGEEVQINIIGNVKPIGICGTGLIDAVAEMLRTGVLDVTGRMLPLDELAATVPAALRKRLIVRDQQTDFILVHAIESGVDGPIMITQKDIRELQLAAGAVRAGINILLKRAGIAADELDAVLLAGAFGNFIRRNNARRIGLLPQIPCDKIRFIGNAASLGAKMALLSSREREYSERLRGKTEHVDLSLDPEFQMEFSAAMLFPEHEPVV